MREFSKKLLLLDYIVTAILIATFFVCMVINSVYVFNITKLFIDTGIDASSIVVTLPCQLDILGILIGTWVAQLGISSGAYYLMCKSDHKIQLPMRLINDLPSDIKETVDFNQIITTVLSTSDN